MITPQSLPTLRIGEIWVLKVETTKLGFNWPPLPLDHPRNVLKQSVCEQFESRLGNFSKIMYEADALFVTSASGQLHYKLVETHRPLIVRDGNLSLTANSLLVRMMSKDGFIA